MQKCKDIRKLNKNPRASEDKARRSMHKEDVQHSMHRFKCFVYSDICKPSNSPVRCVHHSLLFLENGMERLRILSKITQLSSG